MNLNDLGWAIFLLPLLSIATVVLSERPRSVAWMGAFVGAATTVLSGIVLINRLITPSTAPWASVITFFGMSPYQHGPSGELYSSYTGMVGVWLDSYSIPVIFAFSCVMLLASAFVVLFARQTEGDRRLSLGLGTVHLGVGAAILSANVFTMVLGWGVASMGLFFLLPRREAGREGARRLMITVGWQMASYGALLAAAVVIFDKYSGYIATYGKAPLSKAASDIFDWGLLQQLFFDKVGAVADVGQHTVLVLCAVVIVAAALRAGILPWTSAILSVGDAPVPIPALIAAALLPLPAITLLWRMFPLLSRQDHALTVVALVGIVAVADGVWHLLFARRLSRLLPATAQVMVGMGWIAVAAGEEGALVGIVVAGAVSFLSLSVTMAAVSSTFSTDDCDEVAGIPAVFARSRIWIQGALFVAGGGIVSAMWGGVAGLSAALMRNRVETTGGHLGLVMDTLSFIAVLGGEVGLAVGYTLVWRRLTRPVPLRNRPTFRLDRARDIPASVRRSMAVWVVVAFVAIVMVFPAGGLVYRVTEVGVSPWTTAVGIYGAVLATVAALAGWAIGRYCMPTPDLVGWSAPQISAIQRFGGTLIRLGTTADQGLVTGWEALVALAQGPTPAPHAPDMPRTESTPVHATSIDGSPDGLVSMSVERWTLCVVVTFLALVVIALGLHSKGGW